MHDCVIAGLHEGKSEGRRRGGDEGRGARPTKGDGGNFWERWAHPRFADFKRKCAQMRFHLSSQWPSISLIAIDPRPR